LTYEGKTILRALVFLFQVGENVASVTPAKFCTTNRPRLTVRTVGIFIATTQQTGQMQEHTNKNKQQQQEQQ
jgi:hypothetical protein